MTCEVETAPRVTVDPDDPALSDGNVLQLSWYHTSTQADWPTPDFDPAAQLTEETRRRIGGDHHVARWAERQRAKALHIDTYEAAIHKRLRRIHDQADHGSQFYLYRGHLAPTGTVGEAWLIDPSNFVGDVVLDQVCSPGIDVTCYLNYPEDPGALSLALGRSAIASTQRIAIPPLVSGDPEWIASAVRELECATVTPQSSAGSRQIGRRSSKSPKIDCARQLAAPLMQRLPVNLRSPFEAAAALSDNQKPEEWAPYVKGLANMLLAPDKVLTKLDLEEVRYL